MSDPELLVCPFCGNRPLLRKDAHARFYILCENCCCVDIGNKFDRESIIAAWNRRSASPRDAPSDEQSTAEMAAAIIKDDCIVIRLSVANLPIAIEGMWAAGYSDTRWKITDAPTFAKEFVNSLNRESEDGTTLIHKCFDAAVLHAIEQGAEGVEEHEDQES